MTRLALHLRLGASAIDDIRDRFQVALYFANQDLFDQWSQP